MKQPIREVVGATSEPVVLQGRPVEVAVPLKEPTGPAKAAIESAEHSRNTYIEVDNVTGSEPTTYAVYLNLPPGADPRDYEDHFVGLLPMFGVAEASRADERHPGSGLDYRLNATRTIQRLRALQQGWDPKRIRVNIVPWRDDEAPRPAVEAAVEPITVGRVSVSLE